MKTIRVRLTLIYTGLFIVTATVLLVTVNLLLRDKLGGLEGRSRILGGVRPEVAPVAPRIDPGQPLVAPVVRLPPLPDLAEEVLIYQWGVTGVTVAVLTLVSLVVGWFFAGRMLRPVHLITEAARTLSLSNLHERIALKGPRDELKELADTFDAMLDRLARSVEGQRRFIANASHELRTPLTVQRAAIEIGLPDEVGEIRAKLLTANHRIERLIDALLVLAQAEHGLDERVPVALADVVRLAVAEQPHGEVTITLAAEPFDVLGDPILLHRLVTNLVDNAVRYNRPGGTVEITLSEGVLRVVNTGREVPEERFGDLFEPFRRIGTERGRGSGLGLSIVAAIAEAHGAHVRASPNPGGGLELLVIFAGDIAA